MNNRVKVTHLNLYKSKPKKKKQVNVLARNHYTEQIISLKCRSTCTNGRLARSRFYTYKLLERFVAELSVCTTRSNFTLAHKYIWIVVMFLPLATMVSSGTLTSLVIDCSMVPIFGARSILSNRRHIQGRTHYSRLWYLVTWGRYYNPRNLLGWQLYFTKTFSN